MKKNKILILLIGVCIIVYLLNSYFTVINTKDCRDRIGIIDTKLSKNYEGVIFSDNTRLNNFEKTHGDEMLSFLFKCQNNAELYYYDASSDEGVISTNSIIEALNWMANNSVSRVNLSLSNKIKHEELQSWILEHKNIKVYASYNNKLNSYDYPAMYNNVYGSGSNTQINYKNIDFQYKNSNIIIFPNIFKLYKGNSYLSIISMLSD